MLAGVLLLASCAEQPEPSPRLAQATPPAPAPTVAHGDVPALERQEGTCRIVAIHADVAELLSDACARASAGLTRQLGRTAPAGVVVQLPADADPYAQPEPPRRGAESWSLALPASADDREPLDLGAGRHISIEGYFAHEIAHHIATAMLFSDSALAAHTGYGSPLPDWMDEGIALLVEDEADQRARLTLLFEGELIYALPLRRFLYMTHPAATGRIPPGSPQRRIFYAQSLAFTRFVVDRGGLAGWRQLVTALGAGGRQGEALIAIAGLPDDGGTLEHDWLAWLRAHRDPAPAD